MPRGPKDPERTGPSRHPTEAVLATAVLLLAASPALLSAAAVAPGLIALPGFDHTLAGRTNTMRATPVTYTGSLTTAGQPVSGVSVDILVDDVSVAQPSRTPTARTA